MSATKRFSLWFVVTVTLAGAPVSAGSKTIVLEPTKPWTLDYADERCSLIREFGSEGHSLKLEIDSFGSRDTLRFQIAGDLVHAPDSTDEIRYRFSADHIDREKVEAMIVAGDGQKVLSFIAGIVPDSRTLDKNMFDKNGMFKAGQREVYERTVSEFQPQVVGMTIAFPTGAPLEIRVGNMAKPMQALRDCVDDLISSWGMDSAKYRAQSRFPVPAAPIKMTATAHIGQSVLRGQAAFVSARVMIDAQGKATQCIIQTPGLDAFFAEGACNGLMTQYHPAFDSDGKPVASFFLMSRIVRLTI